MGSTLSAAAAAPIEVDHVDVVASTSSTSMSLIEQRAHLDAARHLVAASRPTEALEHIIAVVRSRGGGEPAILAFLDDAKARAASLSPDQLALLLDRLAISNESSRVGEVRAVVCDDSDDNDNDNDAAAMPHQSILEAQGRTAILRDAYRDGSSSLCIYCQSLIKSDRLDAHMSLWCDALVAE